MKDWSFKIYKNKNQFKWLWVPRPILTLSVCVCVCVCSSHTYFAQLQFSAIDSCVGKRKSYLVVIIWISLFTCEVECEDSISLFLVSIISSLFPPIAPGM